MVGASCLLMLVDAISKLMLAIVAHCSEDKERRGGNPERPQHNRLLQVTEKVSECLILKLSLFTSICTQNKAEPCALNA